MQSCVSEMLVQRPKQFSSELSSFTYLIHNVLLLQMQKEKRKKKRKNKKKKKNKNKRKASKADTEPDSERIREV